jgi:hypothetical protein
LVQFRSGRRGKGRPTATDNREFLRNEPSGFFCILCREPLVPVCAPDRFEFAFGCSRGHVATLDHLFSSQRDELRNSFKALIGAWEKTIGQLTEGAAIARSHGSQDLELRLRRRVATLEEKIRLFRDTFLADPDPI